MKNCRKCGARMPDDATVCTECRTEFTESRASGNQERQNAEIPLAEPTKAESINYQTVYIEKPASELPPDAKGKAIAALVIGLVGIFISIFAPVLQGIPAILALVVCIVGIVVGVKARNKIPVGAPGRGMATAGMTCSILGMVISLIEVLVFIACVSAIACALCASTPSAYVDYTILFSFI